MNWNIHLSSASAQNAINNLASSFEKSFGDINSSAVRGIKSFDLYGKAIDYCVAAGKKLIDESRELIAISTKYDIPISKMGQLQMMAFESGQSVGQLARGFRFLEMNIGRAMLNPGGPQAQALSELGIKQEEWMALSTDTVKAQQRVAEQLMKIGDEERRNAMAQEMFGANWQNMLVLIEQSKTAQDDAATSGYKYSESMTQSLKSIGTSFEEIAQDVKPLVMPFVQLFQMLVTIGGMWVEGLKVGVQIIGKTLYAAVMAIVAGVSKLAYYWAKVTAMMAKAAGMTGTAEFYDSLAQGFDKGAGDAWNATKGQFTSMGPILEKSSNEIEKSARRLQQGGYAFAESLGLAEENSMVKGLVKDYNDLTKAIERAKSENIQLTARFNELAKKRANGGLTKAEEEEMNGMNEKLNDIVNKQASLQEQRKEVIRAIERASGKRIDTVLGKKPSDEIKPQTALERKVGIQRQRQAGERAIREAMAQTPAGTEMQSAFEVVKAYEEIKKVEQEIQDLKDRNAYGTQEQADMEHKLASAKLGLMEKEKAHEAFMFKMTREREDAEKGRKDDTIKMMQEREQTYMTRQGMTGMDKQSVAVQNSIEQMMRDEEQLQKVMNDPRRNLSEREAAKKKFEGSTQSAMKEFDKLSLMQFQYGASDAAKKGMGGGIDIRENQLQISKQSLEYLRKQYELQLKQYGLTPDQFGNVPFQMQGPMRAGK